MKMAMKTPHNVDVETSGTTRRKKNGNNSQLAKPLGSFPEGFFVTLLEMAIRLSQMPQLRVNDILMSDGRSKSDEV